MTDREAFEAWAMSKGISIERDGFGGYDSHWTEGALEGWQAALQSQQAAAEPVAWTVQMGIDLLKSGASITVFPKSGERDVPLYTHPAPDHTALLRQALDALRLPCDRWNKQQTEIVNAAIAAIEGALK